MGAIRWTDEDVAVLRRALAEGLTAAQIAERLDDRFTRNAVLGKVLRLGLQSRNDKGAGPRMQKIARTAASPKPKPVEAAVSPPATTEVVPNVAPAPVGHHPATARPWVQRGHNECKWPLGAAGELSCCARVVRGGYCAEHAAIAFRPTPPMRSLKRLAALR